nr:hypothetical protein [Angustibacter aerolatus]
MAAKVHMEDLLREPAPGPHRLHQRRAGAGRPRGGAPRPAADRGGRRVLRRHGPGAHAGHRGRGGRAAHDDAAPAPAARGR